ncbi:efflux RND transporter permease subunit [Azotobacter armeniacus]
MSPSAIALRYQRLVYLLVVGLILSGSLSYFTLPAREDPEITIREAVVTTQYPGLPTEKVELLITKPLERAIRAMGEVEEIRSSSFNGTSIIHVEMYDRHFDLDQLWDELRRRLNEAAPALPEGTRPPRLNTDFSDVAVMTVALTGEGFNRAELTEMAEHLEDAFYATPGTLRVDVFGAQPERVYVEARNARLAELGLDADTLYEALARQNLIRPGGVMETGDQRLPVLVSGAYDDVGAIGQTLIRLPELSAPLPLRDLADVYRAPLDPPQPLAYYRGAPAVIVAIAMHGNYRVLEYAERLRERIDTLRGELPVGYRLHVLTDQSEAVSRAVYGVTSNVLQTLAAVAAVVILFLGVRAGLIVGSIVPAVMLATIAIMGLSGMALERMSLATLVIALGLLVDNGIVIAEDFKRRLEAGQPRDRIVVDTGRELALPLLSSTLTTILVFLPLMLSEHISGEYTRSVSLVILISLLLSWLIAMTLTPLLCYHFACPPAGAGLKQPLSQRLFETMNRHYERRLRWLLRRPRAFLGAMGALLVLAVWGLKLAPQQFFPDSDRPQVQVFVDLPAEASREATDHAMRGLGDMLEEPPFAGRIVDHAAYVGSGGPRFVLSLTPIDPAPNRGYLLINARDRDDATTLINDLRNAIPARFPELSARIAGMFLGPSDSTQLDVRVSGPDADTVEATGKKVASAMKEIPGAIHVRQRWENRVPHLVVTVDQARARRAGLNTQAVIEAAAARVSGREISIFHEGDESIPIVARAPARERRDPRYLAGVMLRGEQGQAVPLEQVAALELDWGYGRIERVNMTRTLTVEGRNTRMTAEDMVPLLDPVLDAIRAELPPGHSIRYDGVVRQSAEARAGIIANLPLCLAIAALLLVAQFNSLRRASLILATIPLLLIGAALGLHVMRANFGFMPLLGLYALAGILVNNAIVLIDRIEIERARTDDFLEAMIGACMRRLRPIVISTVTTVVGLLPLIVFRDALFYGMACVIAFGLLIGTLLTLGVVPALYLLIFRPRGSEPRAL